ncbi:D-alanyl-D-alanine carboxypeptidase [Patescibacteria group bacterium]|nr:MAG: D-alanyl-D-alanine carboxypeptidase [Patescibacteria group bacterium]
MMYTEVESSEDLNIMKRIKTIITAAAFFFSSAASATALATTAPELTKSWGDLPETELSAKSAIVVDWRTGALLYSKNPDSPRSAASLTKLMTAVIFLEQKPRWQNSAALLEEDEVGGGRLRLAAGTRLTVKDLFYSALVGSANNAAMALMRLSGMERLQFIRDMNVRAATLGMVGTSYVEPTGMSPENVTTARDVIKLAAYAFANKTIRRATQTGEYRFKTQKPVIEKRIKNTNSLLLDDNNGLWITGGKTGYLEEAQYNLVIAAETPGHDKRIIVAILGADSKQKSFEEAERLVKWAWTNYEWIK